MPTRNGHHPAAPAPVNRIAERTPAKVEVEEPEQKQDGVNVGATERSVSAGVGAALAVLGLSNRSLAGLLVAALGAGLVYRGVSGHCPMYRATNVNTAKE